MVELLRHLGRPWQAPHQKPDAQTRKVALVELDKCVACTRGNVKRFVSPLAKNTLCPSYHFDRKPGGSPLGWEATN